MASRGETEVRVAAAADAATFGRLLHAFNVEFDEETPDPNVIAERAVPLIDSGEVDAARRNSPGLLVEIPHPGRGGILGVASFGELA